MLGLGNVVRSDDGVGVHAVRRLVERYETGDDVEVVEGGTAGLLLLPCLVDCERAVVADAIDLGAAPGTLHRLCGDAWASELGPRISQHDVGLADLLNAAALSGGLPAELVLMGVQPADLGWGTALSPAVGAVLDDLVGAIAAQVDAWGARARERAAPRRTPAGAAAPANGGSE